ncbi:MAG TPA: DUF2069 domain-containing protein [Ideonella sp.]|nr:DUF2069 domain-containing protein [Ideonella sp.]
MSPAPSATHAASPLQAPSPPLAASPDAVTRWTRILAVGSLLGLIVLGLLWELWLAPTGNGTLAFKVLPLAVPLAGLLKHRMYTYRWVSLMVWLYCTEGLVRATSERGIGAGLAAIEVLLCVVLFVACAVQVRWRLKRAAQSRAAESAEPVEPAKRAA